MSDLVRGDVIDVKFGDRLPADIRVLSAQSLKVGEICYFVSTAVVDSAVVDFNGFDSRNSIVNALLTP